MTKRKKPEATIKCVVCKTALARDLIELLERQWFCVTCFKAGLNAFSAERHLQMSGEKL